MGWNEALTLESRENLPKAVVVPAIGGRVVSYGTRGQNILWLDESLVGRTVDLSSSTGTVQPGGFQCDLGPSSANLPDRPGLWVGRYEWSAKKNYLLSLRGPPDKNLGVELEKEIQFDPTSGDLGFVHRVKNIGDRDAAYCLWHRIAVRPGGYVLLPVNAKSRFPAGWSQRRDVNGRPAYDGTQPDVAGVRLMDGVLVAHTTGAGGVMGTDSDAQWVAYALGRTLFVVHFPVYLSATYAEGGNTVTVAWDASRTELQPYSPEARLRSRKSYEFPLKWTVIELPAEITGYEQARALVDQIPGSPFL